MILLQQINIAEGYAEMVRVDLGNPASEVSMVPLMDAARALGLRQLRVRDEAGKPHVIALRPDPSRRGRSIQPTRRTGQSESRQLTTTHRDYQETSLLGHRWTLEEGCAVYDARFSHESFSLPLISAYVTMLLASIGANESQIMQLRLAVYEISANIIEHGIVRRNPAEIGIHIALMPGEVRGWIQDSCEHFNPLSKPAGSVKEHMTTRASRGYGIHMMRQLLQELDHQFNSTGNRTLFKKRIAS